MAISKVAGNALESVRSLIKSLPTFSREEVDELIAAELKGKRRRSIVIRLAQRAAKLDADRIYSKVMKEYNNGS